MASILGPQGPEMSVYSYVVKLRTMGVSVCLPDGLSKNVKNLIKDLNEEAFLILS